MACARSLREQWQGVEPSPRPAAGAKPHDRGRAVGFVCRARRGHRCRVPSCHARPSQRRSSIMARRKCGCERSGSRSSSRRISVPVGCDRSLLCDPESARVAQVEETSGRGGPAGLGRCGKSLGDFPLPRDNSAESEEGLRFAESHNCRKRRAQMWGAHRLAAGENGIASKEVWNTGKGDPRRSRRTRQQHAGKAQGIGSVLVVHPIHGA